VIDLSGDLGKVFGITYSEFNLRVETN